LLCPEPVSGLVERPDAAVRHLYGKWQPHFHFEKLFLAYLNKKLFQVNS
jgi:hypothetical protein